MFKRKRAPLLTHLILAILGLLLTHCQVLWGAGNESSFTGIDENALSLYKKIRLGATYSQVHGLVSELSELTPEGGSATLAGFGLFEATALTQLFGQPTTLEFNFENGSLYSFYFSLFELDHDAAIHLYHRITGFYASVFSCGTEEKETVADSLLQSFYWPMDNLEAVATLIIKNEVSILSWGFQKPRAENKGLSNE